MLLVAGALVAPRAIAQSHEKNREKAEVLLAAAEHRQLVDGDLEAAIRDYKNILAGYASNHPVAAKALVEMGECYEKLGQAEAQKAYLRVLREYPDQEEMVAEARTRLTALASAVKPQDRGIVIRRVRADLSGYYFGGPSADGRYLIFGDWGTTGDLAILDLAKGESHHVTNKESGGAMSSALSPDGKRIAYAWFNRDYGTDLRVIGTDGSAPRIVYPNHDLGGIDVAAWSPDGQNILAVLGKMDRTHQIAMVSVHDGSVWVLKTLDWRKPGGMSLSPDGRYVAYDFPPKQDAPERNIFLLRTDGSRETPVVEGQSDNRMLGWAPDGKHVLFASDRSGALGAWIVQVADGKPEGPPELVNPHLGGQIIPIGFARNGSFFYEVTSGTKDIYTAMLDPSMCKVTAPPTPFTQRFIGSNEAPAWSPDGKYLAYLSRRGSLLPDDLGARIVIRAVATGEERELVPALQEIIVGYGGMPWSPDGRTLLVVGQDAKRRYGLYRTDVQTGATTPLVREESGGIDYWQVWSPEGKSIFFVRRDYEHKIRQLVVRDLETGKEKELVRFAWRDVGDSLALSPDGRQVAFVLEDIKAGSGSSSLEVVSAVGGQPRELLKLQRPEGFAEAALAWTGDGSQLLFGKYVGPDFQNRKSELWRIPAEGGKPQPLGLAMVDLRDLSLDPNTGRIAFTVRQDKAEVWVMENFLPVKSASR